MELTESLQGVGHGLVLHHVDETPPQAEVGEDEQNVLQDVVDPADLLQNPNNRSALEPRASREDSVPGRMAGARTHVVPKQLHDEGGDAAVDADEDVDAGEDHVGRAGDGEEERRRVHQRGDGPPEGRRRREVSLGILIFLAQWAIKCIHKSINSIKI